MVGSYRIPDGAMGKVECYDHSFDLKRDSWDLDLKSHHEINRGLNILRNHVETTHEFFHPFGSKPFKVTIHIFTSRRSIREGPVADVAS